MNAWDLLITWIGKKMIQKIFICYITSLLGLLFIDGAWLFCTAKNLYMKQLSHLMSVNPIWLAAALFYIIYAYGITHFVVFPALEGCSGFRVVFLNGALLGFVAYATYDLTNHATLSSWPIIITLIDLIWGTCMTGLVSMISYAITKATW